MPYDRDRSSHPNRMSVLLKSIAARCSKPRLASSFLSNFKSAVTLSSQRDGVAAWLISVCSVSLCLQKNQQRCNNGATTVGGTQRSNVWLGKQYLCQLLLPLLDLEGYESSSGWVAPFEGSRRTTAISGPSPRCCELKNRRDRRLRFIA